MRVSVADVLAHGAAFDSQQIAQKDILLEVEGKVVAGMPMEEVEKTLSGLAFSSVKIKLSRFVGGTYVVEIERRNGQDDVDSALERLERHLREDTCKTISFLHYDLNSLKTQMLNVTSKHEKDGKEWSQEKDDLNSEITALKLQLAASDKHQQEIAEDMLHAKEQHGKEISDMSLKLADSRRVATQAQTELDALLSTHSGLKSELQKSVSDGQANQNVSAQARKEADDFRSEVQSAAAAAEQLKTQVSASALNTNKLHLR
jgi:chromosome segregation ATPase